MCEKTCNDCREFIPSHEECAHPMVYLNHSDNTHHTEKKTPACGFFESIKELPK